MPNLSVLYDSTLKKGIRGKALDGLVRPTLSELFMTDHDFVEQPSVLYLTGYTNDQCEGGIAGQISISSNYGDCTPDKAFDNVVGGHSDDTGWYSAGNVIYPVFLTYDFGTSKRIERYNISAANTYWELAPKDWVFQGSHDYISWDDLDTQTNQTFTKSEKKDFRFSNETSYRYYRIQVNNNSSGGFPYRPSIAEMEMFEGVYKTKAEYNPDIIIPTLEEFSGTTPYASFGPNTTIADGKLRISMPAGTNMGYWNTSSKQLWGDLDMSFDYDISNFNDVDQAIIPRLGLCLYTDNWTKVYQVAAMMNAGGAIVNYFYGNDPNYYEQKTGRPSVGKLRITRTGSTITGYYWNGSTWVVIHNIEGCGMGGYNVRILAQGIGGTFTTTQTCYADNLNMSYEEAF